MSGFGKPLKIFLIILLALFSLQQTTRAQTAVKLRSTLSSSGSSGSFSANGRQYYIQQSTGQLSVIGIAQKHDYLLRQGFIQPLSGTVNQKIIETLPVIISPNPVSAHMVVSFSAVIVDPLYITIYDLYGKIAWFRKYGAARELDLDLTSLPPSVYVIRVNTITKSFYSKIIKL